MPQSQASQFRNRANVGLLALAFLVILATSFISVRSINALREAIGWITHTMTVKDDLARLQSALHDLEIAGLRFMIDGRADHREELLRNVDAVGKGIGMLRVWRMHRYYGDPRVATLALALLCTLVSFLVFANSIDFMMRKTPWVILGMIQGLILATARPGQGALRQ